MTDRAGAGKISRLLHEKLAVPDRRVSPRTRHLLYLTALMLVLAGAGFFFLTLSDVLHKDDLATWDEPVNSWFVSQRSEAATVVMSILAAVFGPVAMPIIVLTVTVTWTITARHAWRPLLLAAATFTGVLLAKVITYMVGRPRPPLNLMLLGNDSSYSFPSGHVLGASAFLLVGAFLVLSRRTRIGPAIAGYIAAVAGILTQAASRLYLGYHWLTDSLASIALSLIVLGAVIALDTWRTTRVPPEPGQGTKPPTSEPSPPSITDESGSRHAATRPASPDNNQRPRSHRGFPSLRVGAANLCCRALPARRRVLVPMQTTSEIRADRF